MPALWGGLGQELVTSPHSASTTDSGPPSLTVAVICPPTIRAHPRLLPLPREARAQLGAEGRPMGRAPSRSRGRPGTCGLTWDARPGPGCGRSRGLCCCGKGRRLGCRPGERGTKVKGMKPRPRDKHPLQLWKRDSSPCPPLMNQVPQPTSSPAERPHGRCQASPHTARGRADSGRSRCKQQSPNQSCCSPQPACLPARGRAEAEGPAVCSEVDSRARGAQKEEGWRDPAGRRCGCED